jgi:hypothetical protein
MKYLITTLFLSITCIAFAQSPYISKVYDFQPAPGQFINTMPKYNAGDTQADMLAKVNDCLVNNAQLMISLGGYGGYVVFGFDHLIQNVPGKYDFKILGNAFWAAANPNPGASKRGGSCEPGIVMVSYDANGNGQPDDTWYELAGSEYHKPETAHNYEITYYRPDENKLKTPDSTYKYLNDTTYIRWTTNGHGNGYMSRNVYHNQPYYPQWLTDSTLTFSGTKLADNYVDESGVGLYYVQYAYDWGYADNNPNTEARSGFSISWAVDDEGNPAQLPGVNFVKVYTGVNQYCGWLGETSSEILGAEDLHLTGGDTAIDIPSGIVGVEARQATFLLQNPVREQMIIAYTPVKTLRAVSFADIYNLTGKRVLSFPLAVGTNRVDCPLRAGLYVLVVDGQAIKFIKG